jgi:hypothetical protein
VTHDLSAGTSEVLLRLSELGGQLPVAQLEAVQLEEALRRRQQIGVVPGLLGQRLPITRERAWTLAADNGDDENGGVANSKLRISRTSHCCVIGGLRC